MIVVYIVENEELIVVRWRY